MVGSYGPCHDARSGVSGQTFVVHELEGCQYQPRIIFRPAERPIHADCSRIAASAPAISDKTVSASRRTIRIAPRLARGSDSLTAFSAAARVIFSYSGS